jgi:hypothetical protein
MPRIRYVEQPMGIWPDVAQFVSDRTGSDDG